MLQSKSTEALPDALSVEFVKSRDRDLLNVRRGDGTIVHSSLPKKGLFPHDAVHLVVERHLQYRAAFWGRVFAGAAPEDVGAMAKAGGHASASRAGQPAADIVELLQAERLVECFEVELWGDITPLETFRSVLSAACAQSRVPSPQLSDHSIGAIRGELAELGKQWRELGIGQALRLGWPAVD